MPVTTLPKLTLDGVGVSSAWTPVPLRATVAGEPGVLLVMEMLPVALPLAVGANLAVSVVAAPGLTVAGTVRPLILKPAPEALAAEIVNVAFPEFVRVILCVALLPTLTLPKATLAGLIVSCA